MVQRRFLTPDFVNSVQPPAKGEVWIADTHVKGFGLRLFASDKLGKSFAIRVQDETGRLVRKSFSKSRIYRWHSGSSGDEVELGELLKNARSWARDEIDQLKHQNLAEKEGRRDRDEVSRLVREMTFRRAAESLINGVMGRTQSYTTSLFSILKYIPDRLMHRALSEITPEEMAEAIVNNGIDPGNMRKLRSLVVQVYKRTSDFEAGLGSFEEQLSKHIEQRLEAHYDSYPELRKLKREDCDYVLECLESEHNRWHQAMCIRLYFELGAQWRAICDGYWYPYLPFEKKYWFESREYIGDKALNLLARLGVLIAEEFGESLHLFPSTLSDGNKPILVVDPTWRSTLKRCGLPYFPLRLFARRFGRSRNNPSYYLSMLNTNGAMWRAMDNAAEMSKIVTGRSLLPVTSKTYSKDVAP